MDFDYTLNTNEAPAGLHPGYLLPALRREQNPSEAEISSHSSPDSWFDQAHHPELVEGHPRFSAKGDKSFDEAVSSVEKETDKADFKVLHIHDVKETLAGKGFEIEPFKIIEVCKAQFAYAVLKADIKIGLFLPCKINVYVKGGKTYISGMRPIVLPRLFPSVDLGDLPKEVDQVIKTIVDKSTSGR
ncbi:MAG: DUF302 domain-containing protein [Patescibacteria group bacterium]